MWAACEVWPPSVPLLIDAYFSLPYPLFCFSVCGFQMLCSETLLEGERITYCCILLGLIPAICCPCATYCLVCVYSSVCGCRATDAFVRKLTFKERRMFNLFAFFFLSCFSTRVFRILRSGISVCKVSGICNLFLFFVFVVSQRLEEEAHL